MADPNALKQFLTEEQIEVERQRRQADWERVRSAQDPVEAPPEVFDNRSLYEKLKTQHDAKKKEFEDMWAAKNSIRGLDEDEATFLERIDHARMEKQRKLKQMEQEAIDELKKAQKDMEEAAALTSHRREPVKHHPAAPVVNKQKQLLSGIVKRKNPPNESLKRPLEEEEGGEQGDGKQKKEEKGEEQPPPARLPRLLIPGGHLPGIGPAEGFSDSSDSNESSDDDGLSRYATSAGMQSSIAQRKKIMKQLQDLAAASGGGE